MSTGDARKRRGAVEAGQERDASASKREQRALARGAADCAERALPFFENEHPQDDRPRKAIDAARAWARGEATCAAARAAAIAAHAAARAAEEGAARKAARAAGHAAATAHMAGHARHADAYAAAATASAKGRPHPDHVRGDL